MLGGTPSYSCLLAWRGGTATRHARCADAPTWLRPSAASNHGELALCYLAHSVQTLFLPCFRGHPAHLHPGRLARHLGIVRRIRHLSPSVLSRAKVTNVAIEHLQRSVKLGRCAAVEVAPGVPVAGKAVTHGDDREILRRDLIELIPRQRSRDLGLGGRSDGVRRGNCAVTGHLVEVDEDPPTALLFPPANRGVVRHPASKLSAQCDYRMPSLDEAVRWLDGNEHVDTTTATGLGVAHEASIVEDTAKLVRRPYRVGEVGAGLWVKIDAELVYALGIEPLDWPRVIAQRAQIGHPSDHGQLGRTDFVSRSTRWKGDGDGLHPVGHSLARRPLLVEGLPMGVSTRAQLNVWSVSARPALHGDRAILKRGEHPVTHRQHVFHHVDLGQPDVGEVHLVRAGHPYGAVTDVQFHRRDGHER